MNKLFLINLKRIFVLSFISLSVQWAQATDYQAYLQTKLKKAKISNETIALILQNPANEEEQKKTISLNVLGFLDKGNYEDYAVHYSPDAIEKCKEFLVKNKATLEAVEKKYKVSKEVITALLWVETKHGTHLGKHTALGVYSSLLLSDNPEIIAENKKNAAVKVGKTSKTINAKVVSQSKKKSNWALDQIRALDKIRIKTKQDISQIKSSYAGAFGVSQFIPYSYLKWAKAFNEANVPDLNNMDDGITSVANYLKTQGYKNNNVRAQKKALFHYNRAKGYGEVILKIANDLKVKNQNNAAAH